MAKQLICILVLIVLIALAGCVPGDGKHTEANPAGFSGESGTVGSLPYRSSGDYLTPTFASMNRKIQAGGTMLGFTLPLSAALVVSP